MNELFLQWAKEHTEELRERGITSEIIDHTDEIREKHLQNPCQVVHYDTTTHVGYVGVWKTGCMDIEILNVETEEME